MARKKKVNLPLIEVIIISAVLHVVAIGILGGLAILHYQAAKEPDFEAPPPAEAIEPQVVNYQQQTQDRARQSSLPDRRIQVNQSIPTVAAKVNITMPEFNPGVAVGGVGNTGTGRLGGVGGQGGIGKGDIAVDFFGVKSSGQKFFFIINAGRSMLLDRKGGLWTYRVVKEEVNRLIDELPGGALFNVAVYDWGSTSILEPGGMLAATDAGKARAREWLAPINDDPNRLGIYHRNNYKPTPIEPMGTHINHHFRPIQAAMEQGAEAIFLITGDWRSTNHHPYDRRWTEEEIIEWRRNEMDFDEEDQQAWNEAVAKARAILAKENQARKERGMPPRVIQHIDDIVRESVSRTVRRPPIPPRPEDYDADDVEDHFQNVRDRYYGDRRDDGPSVNVILFLAEDENFSKQDEDTLNKYTRRLRGDYRVLRGLRSVTSVVQTKLPEGQPNLEEGEEG